MTTTKILKMFAAASAIALLAVGQAWSQANLYVSEFSLTPSTPVQGQPVQVRVGVYNNGTETVAAFTVKWWPGENYPTAACTWNLPYLRAGAGQILNCTYAGYPSWYGSIKTRVMVDTANAWAESNEADNDYRVTISVSKPAPAPMPNLFISEMSLNPPTPVQGQPVQVRIGVYNNGGTTAGPSRVEWWPGENYPSAACGWNVGPLVKNGGRILTCTYAGYPSWYGKINTKAAADVTGMVAETNEGDNARLMQIQVSKP